MAPSINVNGHGHVNGQSNGHASGAYAHSQATNGLHAGQDGIASVQGVKVKVNTPHVSYEGDNIISEYTYEGATVDSQAGVLNVTPTAEQVTFKTDTKVGKVGLMMVGWGGNNGTTVSASILANSQNISWQTKEGVQQPNYYGSMVMASTLKIGLDAKGNEIYIPFRDMVPMVHPNDLVISGWDISGYTMDKAMARAQVLEPDLQRQVAPQMAKMKPLPSIYYPDFIAANQEERADNLIPGQDKWAHVEHIRKDIRDFKSKNSLDKVIVLWTANTERYADILPGINDTADNLIKAIKASHDEVSPSTIFAVASIMEDAPYINGAPQNTFVPGCIDLAERHRAYIGGDDFKSGQTKFKSVIADFLISAGIKVRSIASYNHLGNNDGRNLSSERQFKSKEISKRGVVDDMVDSNALLYNKKRKEHPDHCIVIKYLPAVGDSKRALDEYYNEIFMGGRNTVITHNTCEDSLLASPLIIDLVILAELHTRIELKKAGQGEFSRLHSVMSLLSYMLKAPMVKPGHIPINSLTKQRNALNNILRALIGLRPENDMLLETRV